MLRKTLLLSGMLAASSCVAGVEFSDIVKWRLARVEPPAQIKYPVFVLPLNGWSEVELKASTNNFNPASGGITNMAYWYESIGTNAYAGYSFGDHADVRAQLFYCNPDAPANGGRTWILATNALTLTEQIGGNGNYQDTVVVVPSLTVRDGSTNTWMYPENDNLVWVYRRRNAAYDETNGAGRAVFHPVVPVQWRSTPLHARF